MPLPAFGQYPPALFPGCGDASPGSGYGKGWDVGKVGVRLYRFALISGAGWAMDMATMTSLVWLKVPTFPANLIGASLALTFVFFVSQRHIFVHDGHLLGRQFLYYCLWQVAAVSVASLVISFIASMLMMVDWPVSASWLPPHAVVASVLAKVIVTPLTLYSNFLFMTWLLERRFVLY
ncbi:GtrA family protein [Nitrospirillum sp. BR 11828]|uniref:GtrA family protein n=1 Tax=Nitrospirillum sp. BR 11828 TaxID=3104325 RepID=UPI002ACA12E3|nr:GtrA family protein [Nitrospirillum sp. BR 11828]MDZ5650610.1 GtrA family protein [Nitrospirillum sp. BR 11828]